jgi:hypothetical protein
MKQLITIAIVSIFFVACGPTQTELRAKMLQAKAKLDLALKAGNEAETNKWTKIYLDLAVEVEGKN